MSYTIEELQKAIAIFNKPRKHIQCVHKAENGMDFLHYSADLVRAFEVAIEVMEAKLKGNDDWIPIDVAEPGEDGHYLVTFDDGFVTGIEYSNGEWGLWADSGEPIAWMHLPKGYQTSTKFEGC